MKHTLLLAPIFGINSLSLSKKSNIATQSGHQQVPKTLRAA